MKSGHRILSLFSAIVTMLVALPMHAQQTTVFDENKYYTLQTGTPVSYLCAVSGNEGTLRKSAAAPSYSDFDSFLWKIVGNDTEGYTLQNKSNGRYVQDPATIGAAAKVRMTANADDASRYKFVNSQFQLVSNPSWYLASYSNNHNYMAIHNVSGYSGSKITGTAINLIPAPEEGANAVTGNGTIAILNAGNYITNRDADGNVKYDKVPRGKAWQITVEVGNEAANSYNEWGSTILASTINPFDNNYWNNFQLYQHSTSHNKSPNVLNFKSSYQYDHIIAGNASLYDAAGGKFKDYKVIIRYDGDKVYTIRTIVGNEDEVYNNVWISDRQQDDISVMSCALPEGTNLKSLAISIAEESNLMEDVDYAIQNIGSKKYVDGLFTDHLLSSDIIASSAGKFQIKWTGSKDLVYTDTDGGLHNSFLLKVESADGTWKWVKADFSLTDNEEDAQPFIYSGNSKTIQPITAKEVVGSSWRADGSDKWMFGFFANFLVEISGNNNGGLKYKNSTYKNGNYIYLPASVEVNQMANASLPGFRAVISKGDVSLKVAYSPLNPVYYVFTEKTTGAETIYYWDKSQSRLIQYAPNNGGVDEWGEKGDASQWTITESASIPYSVAAFGYGTFVSGTRHAIPSGMQCYIAKAAGESSIRFEEITGEIPAFEPVLVKASQGSYSLPVIASGNDKTSIDAAVAVSGNLLTGTLVTISSAHSGTDYTEYTLQKRDDLPKICPFSGTTLKGFRAYFKTSTLFPSGAKAESMYVIFGDDATEIISLDARQNGAGVIYDISGRKVIGSSAKGGVYIKNGKKFIKK